MANPGLTDAQCREALDAYARAGTKRGAAALLGLRPSTFDNRIHEAQKRLAEGRFGEHCSTVAAPKMRVTISHLKVDPGQDADVLNIGDAHDSPTIRDKSRFKWFGRAAAEWQVSHIVQDGDIFSFDSLCRHEGNETLRGKSKPVFEDDIDSGHEALGEFDKGLQGYDVTKHVTLGNHEDRAISFTNRTPEVAGMLTGAIDNVFMSHGWSYSPFGLIHYIGSVGFVHVPLNKMGKPYGGKTAMQRIANDVCHDLVYGHSHDGGKFYCPKIGTNQRVVIVNAGCALPEGHVEPYVGHGTSGWWYGVQRIKIRDGRIAAVQEITMNELEERFGD